MPGMEAGAAAPSLAGGVAVDNVAAMPTERLDRAGEGFPAGRRVLSYADLRATRPGADPRPPTRDITLHLTGNMQRFMWGFDGRKYSEAEPIVLRRGERVRFVLINDTMMEHPIHLHGLWSELDNGHGERRPYKHTVNVKPGERLSLSGHRRQSRPLGLSLPSPLPHGDGHVPRGARPMSALRKRTLASALAVLATPAAAQMPAMEMPPVMDTGIVAHAVLDQLEGRFNGGNTEFRWDGQGWLGTDYDKLWIKSEGAYANGALEDGQHQLLYSRAVTTYFDLQAGLRSDLDSRPSRSWGAFGIQGLAPYFFDLELTGFASSEGHFAGKLQASYDLLITQRLILQPQVELNLYSKADPSRLVGAGFSDIDAGLRLRYEISRKFAPYLGVVYEGKFGQTANLAKRAGESTGDFRFVFGVRAWF